MSTTSSDRSPTSAPKLTMRASIAPRRASESARAASRAQSDFRSTPRAVQKIRFTVSEWATIVRHAHACGYTPARYVREVALGAVPRVSRTRLNAPVVRELGALLGALQRVRSADIERVGEPIDAEATPHPARSAGLESTASVTEIDDAIARLLAVIRRLS